jgi:geranylgeranyl reductase family protein
MPELEYELQAVAAVQAAATLGAERWDVVVIGAGPAGSMAAIHLADRGHRVLLLDRQAFPRHKTCGDGLIADALDSLCEVGLEADVRLAGHRLESLSIFSSSAIEFSVPGDYVTLRRRELDALMARRAVRAGAAFARGEVVGLDLEPEGGVRCLLAGGAALRARFAVLATGADVRLLERARLASPPPISGFAMRCYVRSPFELDRLVVSFDRAIIPGYAWIFPLGGGLYNVGCGVVGANSAVPRKLHDVFRWFTTHFELARALMEHGEMVMPLKGALLRCGLGGARPVHERLLVVGDALGATLPFTGEGIGKAMQTGRAAALALSEALATRKPARLAGFAQWVERDLRPLYANYRQAQRWFSRAWLNDLVARRVSRSPRLRDAFAGLVSESVKPASIFSVSAMLRSFWG